MAHILDLPEEIILIILGHVSKTESQKFFYSSISRVCKYWAAICSNQQFWQKFDGTLPANVLFECSTKGYLLKSEELVYSPTDYLKPTWELERIFEGMPNLKAINFSKVSMLNPGVLTYLLSHCKNVCAIKLSEDLSIINYFISPDFFGEFLKLQGYKLLILDLSSSRIIEPVKLLRSVAESCCNLEELMLNEIDTPPFPFYSGEFQRKLRKIKVLQLSRPATFPIWLGYTNIVDSPGFPSLADFTYPNPILHDYTVKFTDEVLIHTLSKSYFLKTLNLRGHKNLTKSGFLSLPANRLEELYIANTRLNSKNVGEILQKWLGTLRIVDISYLKSKGINIVLMQLTSTGKMCSLEHMNLSHTDVNKKTVICLIVHCEKLHTLNLTFCSQIGKECEREFRGRAELLQLCYHLQSQY